MPSDLLELTRQIQGQSARGAELGEHFLKAYRAGMENEQLRRDMETQQQLRALFARGQQPSMGEIGQYAPELAMKYNPMGLENLKLQSEIMKSQQQMQESAQKQEFERLNRQGQAVVPLIDEYHMAVQQGMPEMQAQERFRARLGQLIPVLEQSGIGFKAGLTGNVMPEQLEQIYAGVGAPSMRLQSMMEHQKARAGEMGRNMVPERPSYADVHGKVLMQDGFPVIQPPLPSAQDQDFPRPFEKYTEKQLLEKLNNSKQPVNQALAKAELAFRQPQTKETGPGADGRFYTPQEIEDIKRDAKAKETAATEEAKLKVEDKQALNKNVNVYQEIPDIKRIDNLIEGSIGGDIDYWLNRIGGVAGESLKKGDNTAALNIIAGQLVQTAEKMPGAQSDADLKAKIESVGAINQMTSPESRKAAIHELVSYMDRKIANRVDDLDISESQAVRMAREGKISKATLAEIHRRHSGKWGQKDGR